MYHLDLFSGIGGFALAAKWAGFETIGFCEIEEYPRKVLAKNFPGVYIHKDIRELHGGLYDKIDLITGGYPCQPFSTAGKRKGAKDDRHLWPEMLRVIKQARPTWVVAENVAGHITMGLDQTLLDLETEGYTTRTVVIPACALNAPHRRDRVWVIAHSQSERKRPREESRSNGDGVKFLEIPGQRGDFNNRSKTTTKNVAPHNSARVSEFVASRGRAKHAEPCLSSWWSIEPDVGRMANGVPRRMDRLKGLGNAIVPQIAYKILKAIQEANK